jgi:four helix bundle protein
MMAGQAEKGLASLTVWKKAIDFAEWIIKEILVLFPVEERYALVSQLRRSVQSIPANIAEGFGRFYYQEGVRFCYIARGSWEESRSHLELAYRLNYLTGDQKRTAEE